MTVCRQPIEVSCLTVLEDWQHLNMRIVVFAPHPDDETLGCGGTIAKKISNGFEVFIVLVTDGRYAYSKGLGIESNPTPEELSQIRKEEFIRATSILGVPQRNLRFLDFEDGTIQNNEKEVEANILRIMKELLPTEVYFPFRQDCHPDHQALNRTVLHGLRELGFNCAAYQYPIMHKYARVGPIAERTVSLLKRNRIRVDISGFLDIKEKAINEYKSEIRLVSGKNSSALRREVKCFLQKHETFYVASRISDFHPEGS